MNVPDTGIQSVNESMEKAANNPKIPLTVDQLNPMPTPNQSETPEVDSRDFCEILTDGICDIIKERDALKAAIDKIQPDTAKLVEENVKIKAELEKAEKDAEETKDFLHKACAKNTSISSRLKENRDQWQACAEKLYDHLSQIVSWSKGKNGEIESDALAEFEKLKEGM